jgi:hypothetical protein
MVGQLVRRDGKYKVSLLELFMPLEQTTQLADEKVGSEEEALRALVRKKTVDIARTLRRAQEKMN